MRVCLYILSLLQLGFAFTSAVINLNEPTKELVDATENYQLSNDENYEFMVTLHESTVPMSSHYANLPVMSSLVFHWNTPTRNQHWQQQYLSAQLVHTVAAGRYHGDAGARRRAFSTSIGGNGTLEDFEVDVPTTDDGYSWICLGAYDGKSAAATSFSGSSSMAVNVEGSKAMIGVGRHDDNIDPIYEIVIEESFREQLEDQDYRNSGLPIPDMVKNNIQRTEDDSSVVIVMKFTQPLSYLNISSSGANYFIYSIGSSSQSVAAFSSFVLDFDPVLGGQEGDSKLSSLSIRVFVAHGFFGTVAFALCIPLAFSSAIFRNVFPTQWMVIHSFCNILGGGLGLFSFLLALIGKGAQGRNHFTDAHHITGLFLILLLMFQIQNALMRPGLKLNRIPSGLVNDYSRLAFMRTLWLRIHRVVGVSVLGLGLYQTCNGFNKFSNVYHTKNLTSGLLVFVAITTTSLICGKTYWMLYGDEAPRSSPHDHHHGHEMIQVRDENRNQNGTVATMKGFKDRSGVDEAGEEVGEVGVAVAERLEDACTGMDRHDDHNHTSITPSSRATHHTLL